jgi:hypothetical protein
MSIACDHVERIDADADRVWSFFRWDNLEAMRPGGFFVAVEYRERRPVPGAVRVVTLAGGARLVERLEAEDGVGRRLAYTLLDAGEAPVADYRGEVVVSARGPDAALVTFACTCTPVGISADEWCATWTAMQIANAAFIRAQVAAIGTKRRP